MLFDALPERMSSRNPASTKKKEYHQLLGKKTKRENTTISESVRDVQKENNGGTCIFKLEKGKYYGPHRIIYPPLSLPEH